MPNRSPFFWIGFSCARLLYQVLIAIILHKIWNIDEAEYKKRKLNCPIYGNFIPPRHLTYTILFERYFAKNTSFQSNNRRILQHQIIYVYVDITQVWKRII